MGYSYSSTGKLCCDHCGSTGARKVKCPHGWCPSTALCTTCKAKLKPQFTEWHKSCAASTARALSAENEMRAHCAAGIPVLWSGSMEDNGMFLATFRDTPAFIRKGETHKEPNIHKYLIPSEVYEQRINMRGYPIPSDFAALGAITIV